MARIAFHALSRRQLRRWLALFFLALAVPAGVLIRQAYGQLKWEAFHQYRLRAEELTRRIDGRYSQLIAGEERRTFADYNFLVVTGDPQSNFIQRSTLAAYPVESSLPGLLGYFQVDPDGEFRTPLLPESAAVAADYGIAPAELAQRQALARRLRAILSENRLVHAAAAPAVEVAVPARTASRDDYLIASEASNAGAAPAPYAPLRADADEADAPAGAVAAQAAFDQLGATVTGEKKIARSSASTLGRVEDLQLDERFQAAAPQAPRPLPAEPVAKLEMRAVRKERSTVAEPETTADRPATVAPDRQETSERIRIRTFESELDPFEFSLLDGGHAVLFRKVWRDGQRYIQGALLDRDAFVQAIVAGSFRETALAQMSDLVVAWQGDVLAAYSGRAADGYGAGTQALRGALLHRARLSAPLSALELIFSIRTLPAGPGGRVIIGTAGVLLLVLCAGFFWMYRLGIGQIAVARQQHDFIAAVSHELKTPLTSIRMYAEMLREGWVSAEKKREYYGFIHDEGERLTRLINNVLQLARMTRNDLEMHLTPVTTAELMATVRPKIAAQTERAGFTLNMECAADTRSVRVVVDQDCFTQVLINLVDNAIKFCARADKRSIDIAAHRQRDNAVVFTVRDYGSGVARDQMKKIFRLFYRSESELTRETVGTGIGLALVQQLTAAMHGSVDVVNVEPGAQFRLRFPIDPARDA